MPVVLTEIDSMRAANFRDLCRRFWYPFPNTLLPRDQKGMSHGHIHCLFGIRVPNVATGIRMAEPGPGDGSGQGMSTPRGRGRGAAVGRRIPSSLSPGRLPTMRSRDLTLGGVKKVGLMKDYVF